VDPFGNKDEEIIGSLNVAFEGVEFKNLVHNSNSDAEVRFFNYLCSRET